MEAHPEQQPTFRGRAAALSPLTCGLLDQAAVSGTNFLTALIVGRVAAEADFGYLILVLSLLLFWDGVRVAFLGSPLAVFLPRTSADRSSSYVGATLVMVVALAVGGAIFLTAAAGITAVSGDAALANAMLIGVLALVGWTGREHVRSVFYAQLHPHRALALGLVFAVLQLSGLAGLVATGSVRVGPVLAVMGVSQAATALAGVWLLRGEFGLSAGDVRQRLATHWRFGGWVFAGLIAFTIASPAYPWLLKALHGVEAAAAFGACLLPLSLSRPLVIGLSNLITPQLSQRLAREGVQSLVAHVRRFQLTLALPMVGLAVSLAVGSRPILDWMYHGKYVEYATLLSIVSIQLVVVAFVTPLNQALLAIDRPRYQFAATATGAATTISVGVFLSIRGGVEGAAIGWLLATAASSVAAWFLYRRALGSFRESVEVKVKAPLEAGVVAQAGCLPG